MSDEKQEKAFLAIVVPPFVNPMARSVFKVPKYADPVDTMPPAPIDWALTCADAIASGKPLRVEDGTTRVLLVPLGHDVFVSIQPWEDFQRQVEQEQTRRKLVQ